MSRIAIVAALPDELKPLVRGWPAEPRPGVALWRTTRGSSEWIAACAGMGTAAAARAFAEVDRTGPIDAVISIGWVGALHEEFRAGKVYRVSRVVDAHTGEHFPAAGAAAECTLVTSDRVALAAEKEILRERFTADLVDMEAAGIARLAAMRQIPFYCVKGVSDGPHDAMPDFNRFISRDGQFATGRFALHALLRPATWTALIRMSGNCRKAAEALGGELLKILEQISV